MGNYQRLWIGATALALMLPQTIASVPNHDQEIDTKRVEAVAKHLAVVAQAEAMELRIGVIVDVKNKRIYLMSPEKSIEAVDIATGRTLWSNTAAAKPLAVCNGLLVCQAEGSASGDNLNFVVLDIDQNGRQVSKSSVKLPAQMSTSIDDDMSSRLIVRAVAVAEDVFVSWEHRAFPVRGMPSLQDEFGQPPVDAQPRQTSGTIRLNPRSGETSSLKAADVPQAVRDARPMNLTNITGAPPNPNQRISIDGRHTLKSKLIGNDKIWNKYQWTIIDNETGKQVVQLKSHLSQTAFFVVDSHIIFETGAYVRRTKSGMVNKPLMVRAVDLTSGEQVWSRPVRDTAYQGTLPP